MVQYRDEGPAHRWIIKSNVVAKNIEFKKAEVIQVVPIGALLERDELILTFEVKDLSDLSLRKLVPQIRDEHGCVFETSIFVPAPRLGAEKSRSVRAFSHEKRNSHSRCAPQPKKR